MSVFLNQRQDGSLALFIDGDLQFDQRDEKIYHEGLIKPALQLLRGRGLDHPKVLIVGGGDGLSARELLDADSVSTIDLVDYSGEVLALAAKQIAHLNKDSLSDSRVVVHQQDAWAFVQEAIKNNRKYDLIAVDLTVAKDADGAKFHCTDWYQCLGALLSERGVLASNGLSPTNTPHAYWSIFNTIRASGLFALPYRVCIPSFSQLGYGPDWGFFIASKEKIRAGQFDYSPDWAQNQEQLKNLFKFPAGFDRWQSLSRPNSLDNDALLYYLRTDKPFLAGDIHSTAGNGMWSSLDSDPSDLPVPVAAQPKSFVPVDLRLQLADKTAGFFPAGGQDLIDDVLAQMPGLQPAHTRSMIAEFITDPASFLEAIDVRLLVDKLIARAGELPQRIVGELVLLRDKLADWTGDFESLLDLGRRVVTTLAVVVILANFIFPDSAYGKGGHFGGSHFGGHRMASGGWNHHWGGNHGRYGGWGRPNHWRRWGYGGWGWGGYGYGGPYYYATGPGYVNNNYNSDQVPDSQGNQYPMRSYIQTYGNVPDQPWVAPSGSSDGAGAANAPADAASTSVNANIVKSSFKLGPDAEVLSDGSTVVTLTDNAYLKVGAASTNLVDQQSGRPLIALYTDPTLTWHLASELKHQSAGLKKAAQSKDIAGGVEDMNEKDELPPEVVENPAAEDADTDGRSAANGGDTRDDTEVANMVTTAKLLDKAEQSLGVADEKPPEVTQAPMAGAFELFNSAWADHDGKFVILKKADGNLVYLDGKNWYSDAGKTKLEAPCPPKLNETISGYLASLAKESSSTKDSLSEEKEEVQAHLDRLKAHRTRLENGTTGNSIDNDSDDSAAGGTAKTTTGSDGTAAAQPKPSGDDMVQFGTRKMTRTEALRRMDGLINRAQKHLKAVQAEIDNLPTETRAVNNLLGNFKS